MQARSLVSKILFLLAIPFVFLGLIDPLEGGISLLAALGIYLLAFLLAKQKPKRYLWVPFLVSVFVGGAALAYAIAIRTVSQMEGAAAIPVVVGVWLYRAAVITLLVGSVTTAYRQFFPAKNV